MSLNTAHANGGVLIYSGERILIYYDGVEMGFDMPGGLSHFKGDKKGRIYLTTHRVIFNGKSLKDKLQSFSMPFHCLKELELEQPVFGSNYIKGKVRAEPDGNWEGVGRFKMWFNHGGAIEFGKCLLEAGKRSSRNAQSQPPAYTAAPNCSYYQAPPPAYAPPEDPYYSFVPYSTFPTAPPDNSVYMYEAPPPYPGINPNATYAAYPPPQANQPQDTAAAAKAAEAAGGGNAYYAPNNPHNVYMPQPYQEGAPPPYAEATKKEQ